jgi:glyoxylase-like metal-dependent hydrolase (beta-lactamase superfamily II)
MTRFDVGALAISRVIESELPLLAAREIYPDWSDEAIAPHLDWMVPRHYRPETGNLTTTIQSYLVRTPHHTILVDACGGNDKDRNRPLFDHAETTWLDTLAAAGCRPEDVDFVLCTHLHVDHVGWNTRLVDGRWVPTFPNAKYLFARTELEHWLAEAEASGLPRTGDYVADSVIPVLEAKREVLVETDHAIEDGVWLEPLPGHTPGQVGLHLESGDAQAVIIGDMMHHMIQCPLPDWSTNFCTDQDAARQTRRAFLERHAETGTLVATAHFPSPSVGTIERAGDAFGFHYLGE